MSARVCAIIPTFRRAELLARALDSLRGQGPELQRIIVVNNSSDAETVRTTSRAPVPVTVLDYGCNLGLAGGIGVGMHELRQDLQITHAWVLDDDVCVGEGSLRAMLRACEADGAEVAAPLLTDEQDVVRWFPGPLRGRAWDLIRAAPRAAEFVTQVGEAPLAWNWAYWTSLLVSRLAFEAVGYPRMDLWFAFTDNEYTLRLSERFRCVLAPAAVVQHLRPVVEEDKRRTVRAYWGLQNADYVSVRLRHGWRSLRHLPGHQVRYLRYYGWKPGAWWDVLRAMVGGAMLGRVAGESAYRAEFCAAAARFPQWNTGPVRSLPQQEHWS